MHIHRSRLGLKRLGLAPAAILLALATLVGFGSMARAEMAETYCTIRDQNRLDCLWVGKTERRRMTSQDVSNFIDQAQVTAYMTVKSRAGLERIFLIDPEAPSFKKLRATERSSSVSDIIKAKSDLFSDIEKRLVRLSDDLDTQAANAELVKFDPSIAVDHSKLQQHDIVQELDTLRDRKTQEQPNSTATDETAPTGLIRSKHRLSLDYEDVGYGGNFYQNGQSRYSSVDNRSALINYTLTLPRWIFQAEAEYFTAYSDYNKGTTGGTVAYAGSDSWRSAFPAALRANYCWTAWGTTQICPGAEAVYDMFPVLSFKTLNYTSGLPNSTSVLEMQSAADLSLGATVLVNVPLYRSVSLYSRFGYLYGTGVLGGANALKSNSAQYASALIEWPMWKGLSANFGLEYLARGVTFQVPGTAAQTATINVDNNNISEFTSRVGLTLLWGS